MSSKPSVVQTSFQPGLNPKFSSQQSVKVKQNQQGVSTSQLFCVYETKTHSQSNTHTHKHTWSSGIMAHFSAHLTCHPSRTLSEQPKPAVETHIQTTVNCLSGLCNHMAFSHMLWQRRRGTAGWKRERRRADIKR